MTQSLEEMSLLASTADCSLLFVFDSLLGTDSGALDPDEVIAMTGRPIAVIDCFGILSDAAIRRYCELGAK